MEWLYLHRRQEFTDSQNICSLHTSVSLVIICCTHKSVPADAALKSRITNDIPNRQS
jgi:hypothetical protein